MGDSIAFWSPGVGLVYTPTPKDTTAVTAALLAAGATRVSPFAVRPGFEDV